MTPIRILLLDDHTLFREGLSRLLADQSDLRITAQCSTIAEARAALARAPSPELILADFDLGEENPLALLKELQNAQFPGKILLVTAGMSPLDQSRALRSGASGVLLKHAPPTQLVASIRQAMRGEPLLAPAALERLLAEGRREELRRAPLLALSPRERAVLRGVFAGLANKEIAAKLSISEGYVKAVLQQLFAKTGVRTRAQLVRIALEHHFDTTDPDPPGPAGARPL